MSTLRIFRERAGLSQDELASKVGTSQPQIFRLEAGQRKITHEWATRLAPALGVTPDHILGTVRAVQIVGLAGAGPDGSILFGTGDGELGEAPPPPNWTATTVALEVRGVSMNGVADDGSLIYGIR